MRKNIAIREFLSTLFNANNLAALAIRYCESWQRLDFYGKYCR
jgi:hypothetical protein